MDGYRYWVERHKLLLELEAQKAALDERPEKEALALAVELERAFRTKLDLLYAEAKSEFEPATRPACN
jgi:hypothetical protein